MKEKDKPEKMMAVCSRQNSGGTKGIRVPCTGTCGETVWLSDSTVNLVKQQYPDADLEKNPIQPMCIECAMPTLKANKDMEYAKPSDEQMDELKKAITALPTAVDLTNITNLKSRFKFGNDK
jgi:hypothetical protein